MKYKPTFCGQNIEFLSVKMLVHKAVTRLSRVNKN
jgi:hypothetical protein